MYAIIVAQPLASSHGIQWLSNYINNVSTLQVSNGPGPIGFSSTGYLGGWHKGYRVHWRCILGRPTSRNEVSLRHRAG